MNKNTTGGGSPQGTEKGVTTVICDDPGLLTVLENDRLHRAAENFVLDKFNDGVSPTTKEHCLACFFAGADYATRYPMPNLFTPPPADNTPAKPDSKDKAPFPDKMTFKEMLSNLFSVDFLSPEELDTISKAGEMYANGCLKQKSDAVNVEWSEDFTVWLIDNNWKKYPDGWTHKGGANGWYCNFAQAYQMFMSANSKKN